MESDLRAGMYVLSIDGQKLGRIARLDGSGFDVVRGRRRPRGFHVPFDEVASRLRGEIFLRQRLCDYLARYEPRDAPAPHLAIREPGKRFLLFRRSEARW